jgi:hypothetical protein
VVVLSPLKGSARGEISIPGAHAHGLIPYAPAGLDRGGVFDKIPSSLMRTLIAIMVSGDGCAVCSESGR